MQNNPQSPGRIVAGRYRLGPRLGSGVDIAAFEAFDEQSQRMVVLKVVHPDLGDAPQVRREFRATMAVAAGVTHPNIAAVHDFGTDQWGNREVLYVVTERFAGGSLRDILDRGRLLAPSQALVVGLDACKALDAVHRAGLVHSNVRPATLVFGDDRRLRLVDVGLAQLLASVGGGASAADSDRVRYASPEQALGLPIEAKSDVYSLCLTLIESLSGSVPFESDSAVATLANRIDKLMPVSADLGPLAAVLERAGRPLAGDRYTAAEFGRALVQAAEKLPRPTPLPIIAGTLFGGDSTGPIAQQAAAAAAAAAPAAPAPVAPTVIEALPANRPLRTAQGRSKHGRSAPPPPQPSAVTMVQPRVEYIADDADLDEYPEPPAPAGRLRTLLVVGLLVLAAAGGTLAWYLSKPEKVTVPELVGIEEAVALNQIVGDFSSTIEPEPSETIATGQVIRTDPAAGTSVDKGSSLTLYVSSGPAPRVLPELKGLTLAEATEQLTDIDLVISEGAPVYDDVVEEGKVVSWLVPDSPALVAGGTVTKGTTVQVVLSQGPNPQPVPDLTGQTFEEATATLTAAGFGITKGDDVFSASVAAGMVAEQDPAVGGSVQPGDPVTVKLSKGPEMVALPDPTGLNHEGLVAALQSAGFTVGKVTGSASKGFLRYQVNGVVAAAGATFPRGTIVEIFYKS
ncbi:MAG: PASTA domain-containing protein [Actinomycetota bacterium]|nr:PASTA domain-containing protein [Actinomycetota bacterium]